MIVGIFISLSVHVTFYFYFLLLCCENIWATRGINFFKLNKVQTLRLQKFNDAREHLSYPRQSLIANNKSLGESRNVNYFDILRYVNLSSLGNERGIFIEKLRMCVCKKVKNIWSLFSYSFIPSLSFCPSIRLEQQNTIIAQDVSFNNFLFQFLTSSFFSSFDLFFFFIINNENRYFIHDFSLLQWIIGSGTFFQFNLKQWKFLFSENNFFCQKINFFVNPEQ